MNGGRDPGAVGPGGTKEKDVALAVARRLAEIISAAGAEVELTRQDDSDVSLARRVEISNGAGADVFISIHANAFTNPAAKGMEVWTSVGQTAADPIAESIANALQDSFLDLVLRTDMSDGDKDKEANFHVLRWTEAPAVLVELAFISNPAEEAMLKTQVYQEKAARAIAQGVAGHLGITLAPAEPKTGANGREVTVPAWAKNSIMWAVANGIITDRSGSEDFYRSIVALHRYDMMKG